MSSHSVHHSDRMLRALYRITSEHRQGFSHQIQQLLQLGCDHFAMDIGVLSHCESQNCRVLYCHCPPEVSLQAVDELTSHESYSAITLAENRAVGIDSIGKGHYRMHPAYQKFLFESLIGVPIKVDGEPYGTLNFLSMKPQAQPFTEIDLDTINLMGVWVKSELERHQRDQELKRSIQHLEQAEQMFRQAIDESPSAILMVDTQGVITFTNALADRLFGYDSHELVGQPVELLMAPELRGRHPALMEHYLKAPSPRPMGMNRDLLAYRRDGSEFPVEIALNPIDSPDGLYILCTLIDLSERKRYEQKILKQAHELELMNQTLHAQNITDNLTGVGNRRLLDIKFETLLLLAKRNTAHLSVIMLDLDNFKQFNDTYGHPQGDEALIALARSLMSCARQADLVARYGGEEFTLVLPETDATGAMKFAERLRAAITGIDSLPTQISASMGVTTVIPAQDDNLALLSERLLKEADQALYQAKKAGKNRACHFSHE